MPKITPGEMEFSEFMRRNRMIVEDERFKEAMLVAHPDIQQCAGGHSIAARHMVGLGCRDDWTPEATRRRALEQLRKPKQPAWPWWAFA